MFSRRSFLRPVNIKLKPSDASALAVPSPIPEVAPVIIAILFMVMFCFLVIYFFVGKYSVIFLPKECNSLTIEEET